MKDAEDAVVIGPDGMAALFSVGGRGVPGIVCMDALAQVALARIADVLAKGHAPRESLLAAEANAYAWRELLEAVLNVVGDKAHGATLDLARKALAESSAPPKLVEAIIAGRKPKLIGKHQARHPMHVKAVLDRLDARGDEESADTVAWLAWHIERAENTTHWLLNDAPSCPRASTGSFCAECGVSLGFRADYCARCFARQEDGEPTGDQR